MSEVKAGRLVIEVDAELQKLDSGLATAVAKLDAFGARAGGSWNAFRGGTEQSTAAVKKFSGTVSESGPQIEGHTHRLLDASEAATALAGAHSILNAAIAKYSAGSVTAAGSTEGLVNSYRALRIALSPTVFTAASIGVGILAEETVRLTNARAKLIEQQSLFSAISGIPARSVEKLDSASDLSGANPARIRSLYGALNSRMDSDQSSVLSGLSTLGVSGATPDTEMLGRIAQGFSSIEDPAKRAAAAVQIFGAANAGIALEQLDREFANSSQAVDKWGLSLDSVSRSQIYRFRQEFVNLWATLTDFSDFKAMFSSMAQGTEVVAAALEDMAQRGADGLSKLIAKIPGMIALRGAIESLRGPAPSAPAAVPEISANSQGMDADELFAQAQVAHDRAMQTAEGQRQQQGAAQAKADAAYAQLQADQNKRWADPHDPSLLSGDQRLSLTVQQQGAAHAAAAYKQTADDLEAAAAAIKQAQAKADELAAWQGKASDRLRELSDSNFAKSLHTPVASAAFSGGEEIRRDADRTTDAENAGRAAIESAELQRVAAEENSKLAKSAVDVLEATAAAQTKDLGEKMLQSLGSSNETSRDQVRQDDAANTAARDAGEHAVRMATAQSSPGDEVNLAKTVMDIRLRTVAAEREILNTNLQNYDLEDLRLADEKLDTEQKNAQLDYGDQLAQIEKTREQAGLSTGGAYQQQLQAIRQEQDALSKILVTDKNINDIQLAGAALANKAKQDQVDQFLALGTLGDGWNAFWVEMSEDAEKPGKILFDGMNSALDRLSGDMSTLLMHPKKTNASKLFGDSFKSIGESMSKDAFKSLAQHGLGALGKHLGIKGPSGKPDGTQGNPFYVVLDDKGTMKNPLDGIVPGLPPAFGSAASSGLGGFLKKIFGGGGASGGIEDVTSSISFPAMASGGNADPGQIYRVAEAGEGEFITPKNASTVTPISKLLGRSGGSSHVEYNIDARNADLGAENRVQRALEHTHNAAVSNGVRAASERAKRTPQRSRG